jgi:hypothetical protein
MNSMATNLSDSTEYLYLDLTSSLAAMNNYQEGYLSRHHHLDDCFNCFTITLLKILN